MNESGEISVEPDGHPTTTHAASGDGNPRLRFIIGSKNWNGTPAREFALIKETTRIGCDTDMDLCLEGLRGLHAEIVHNDRDEYLLVLHGDAQVSHDMDEEGHQKGELHTGARVQLENWEMVFERDEFADHGRPYGGRQGGEFAHQRRQAPRPSAAEPDDAA